MIPESIMGRIVNSSGVEDPQLVRLDVLSVYLLQQLNESGILTHMCFKGGISLRKIFARLPARFSRDMDFVDASYEQLSDKGIMPDEYYYKLLSTFDAQTIHDVHWRVKSLSDEELRGDSLRVDLHFFVYDDRPESNWENRTDNVLSIECSFRRPILLPTQMRSLRKESWFSQLEFTPAPVPVLQEEEAIAEKVRAAFQRNNARDVFDLYQYGQMPFDEELVRSLSVLKCWQDRGLYDGPRNFDPRELLDKLKAGNYKWQRLQAQVSKHAWVDPPELLKFLTRRFGFLDRLTDAELQLSEDRAQKKLSLHDEVWNVRRLRLVEVKCES